MTFDVSNLPKAVVEAMSRIERSRFRHQMARAVESQRRIAKKYHDHPPCPVADCAEMTMALDPRLDTVMRHQYGPDTVASDPEFKTWFMNKDEHGQMARVRTKSRRVQIGFGQANRSAAVPGGFVRTRPGRMLKVYA